MSLLQIILIVLIVFIVVGGGALFMLNQAAERKKTALKVIQGRSANALENKAVERGQNKRRDDIAKKLKGSKEEATGKKKATTALLIMQAGVSISVRKYWLLSFLCMMSFMFLGKTMGQPVHIILLMAIIGLLGFPRFVLKKLAAKRQKEFLEEFPDALEATVRLLKAGMPVSEAVAMIAKEFEGPVGEEMARIYDKQKIGIPLYEAAQEATRGMPLPEMQMFATGLAIQAQTGSSLSEVLSNLSSVIRARFRLKRKIKALSSEAVASAGIIGALPIMVAGGMYFVNYEYISILFQTGMGKFLLSIAIGMMITGIFVMRAMINFKI